MSFSLPDTINLRNIHDVKEIMSKYIVEEKEASINIENCIEIDLSGLQFIESTRVFASSAGKTVKLSGPANAVVTAVLDRAGFTAAMTAEDRLFWFQKEI